MVRSTRMPDWSHLAENIIVPVVAMELPNANALWKVNTAEFIVVHSWNMSTELGLVDEGNKQDSGSI